MLHDFQRDLRTYLYFKFPILSYVFFSALLGYMIFIDYIPKLKPFFVIAE